MPYVYVQDINLIGNSQVFDLRISNHCSTRSPNNCTFVRRDISYVNMSTKYLFS